MCAQCKLRKLKPFSHLHQADCKCCWKRVCWPVGRLCHLQCRLWATREGNVQWIVNSALLEARNGQWQYLASPLSFIVSLTSWWSEGRDMARWQAVGRTGKGQLQRNATTMGISRINWNNYIDRGRPAKPVKCYGNSLKDKVRSMHFPSSYNKYGNKNEDTV